MNRILALIFGFLSCVITAFLNFYIQDLISINIFSFSMFFVIPVGAILVGMAANSGYYFSARMTNRMLDKYDFFMMVGMAAAGLFLIYGIEYYHYVEKAGLSNEVTFWGYIAFVVENSTYYMKLTKFPWFSKLGTVGILGYLFLFIHFIGFLIGGAATFVLLFSADTCATCSKYLKNKKKRILHFDTQERFDNYQKEIDGLEPTSKTFKSSLFETDRDAYSAENDHSIHFKMIA